MLATPYITRDEKSRSKLVRGFSLKTVLLALFLKTNSERNFDSKTYGNADMESRLDGHVALSFSMENFHTKCSVSRNDAMVMS